MKRILTGFAALLLISANALASDGRTGYMDMQTIFNKSVLGRKYQGIMRGYFESRKKMLDADADEIQKLRDDYAKQKQAKSLNGQAQKGQEETLNQKIAEFEKLRTEFADEINQKDEELLNKFYRHVQEVLPAVAKRENLSLILNTTDTVSKAGIPAVMYADQNLDMTDKIIAEMDKQGMN